MKTLLRCNILIIRSGRIESTVRKGDKMREETEDRRKDTMKEELGEDTPGENSQNTYTEEHEFDIWGKKDWRWDRTYQQPS